MLIDSQLLNKKITKILPHVIDSMLLVSAISLAAVLKYNPAEHNWLLAKIVALLIYIGLGVFALKPILTKKYRTYCWLAAILCYGYIVSTAITKSPAGYFAF